MATTPLAEVLPADLTTDLQRARWRRAWTVDPQNPNHFWFLDRPPFEALVQRDGKAYVVRRDPDEIVVDGGGAGRSGAYLLKHQRQALRKKRQDGTPYFDEATQQEYGTSDLFLRTLELYPPYAAVFPVPRDFFESAEWAALRPHIQHAKTRADMRAALAPHARRTADVVRLDRFLDAVKGDPWLEWVYGSYPSSDYDRLQPMLDTASDAELKDLLRAAATQLVFETAMEESPPFRQRFAGVTPAEFQQLWPHLVHTETRQQLADTAAGLRAKVPRELSDDERRRWQLLWTPHATLPMFQLLGQPAATATVSDGVLRVSMNDAPAVEKSARRVVRKQRDAVSTLVGAGLLEPNESKLRADLLLEALQDPMLRQQLAASGMDMEFKRGSLVPNSARVLLPALRGASTVAAATERLSTLAAGQVAAESRKRKQRDAALEQVTLRSPPCAKCGRPMKQQMSERQNTMSVKKQEATHATWKCDDCT